MRLPIIMLMTERYTVIGTGPSTDIDIEIEIEIEIDTAQAQCRVLLPSRQQPNVFAGEIGADRLSSTVMANLGYTVGTA